MVSDAVRGMPGLRTRRLDQRRRRPSPRLTDVAARWGGTLATADVADLRRRPAPDVWSPLEYACHTRDVLAVFEERPPNGNDPGQQLGWWDHDAASSTAGTTNRSQSSSPRRWRPTLAGSVRHSRIWRRRNGRQRSVDQVNASPSEGWRVSCCTRWCITTGMPSSNSRRRRSSGRRRDEPHLVAKRSNRQPGTVTFDPDATLLKIFTDPETISDPYPLYAELREHAPIFKTELVGRWVFTRFEDARALLRDPRCGSGAGLTDERVSLDGTKRKVRSGTLSMLMLNPPDHTRVRASSPARSRPAVWRSCVRRSSRCAMTCSTISAGRATSSAAWHSRCPPT